MTSEKKKKIRIRPTCILLDLKQASLHIIWLFFFLESFTDWTLVGPFCYKLFNQSLVWEDAASMCAQWVYSLTISSQKLSHLHLTLTFCDNCRSGGFLVRIFGFDENLAMASLVSETDATVDEYWIGESPDQVFLPSLDLADIKEFSPCPEARCLSYQNSRSLLEEHLRCRSNIMESLLSEMHWFLASVGSENPKVWLTQPNMQDYKFDLVTWSRLVLICIWVRITMDWQWTNHWL